MILRLVSALVTILSLVFRAQSTSLQISIDDGATWHTHSAANPGFNFVPARANVKFRLEDFPDGPLAELPPCALQGTLDLEVIRDQVSQSNAPALAFRWLGISGCERHNDDAALQTQVTISNGAPILQRPRWQAYVQQPEQADAQAGDEANLGKTEHDGKHKRGFFAKYGLYIMIFMAVALAHGIRQGLAQLRAEMEEEDARQARINSTHTSRTQGATMQAGKVRVVVPTRKKSAKQRKRANASSAS